MSRRLFVVGVVAASLLGCAPAGPQAPMTSEAGATPAPPNRTVVIVGRVEGETIAMKGLAIRIGNEKQAAVCFDTELLRYFSHRRAWLVEPDYNPPKLTPYVQ